ncbi:MAG: PqqD family peptide modification chaperone [Candidatus Scalindua sp.]|nr:PqqD family peptide modification chaperone [Candidatus Scalindua sp.]
MHASFQFIRELVSNEYPITRKDLRIRRESERPVILLVSGPHKVGPEHLNETAALILSLCDGTRNLPAIVDEFSNRFSNLNEQESFVTVTRCVRSLQRKGLLLRLNKSLRNTDD